MNKDDGNEILKNMKLLYVEDDEHAREELSEVLKRRMGKVYTGANGEEGLELFLAHEPEIIIADLYMPKMDGLEMVKKIHEAGYSPAVIITSAVQDVDTIIGAIDVGVVKYILKPVDLKELLAVLKLQAENIMENLRKEKAVLPENRRAVEDEIKREFAAFLKSSTGKGPKNVNVFMSHDSIEIVASEVMTVFEKNILDNNQNIAIIKYIREIFFSTKSEPLSNLLNRISGRRVRLKEVVINVEKDRNKLIFSMDYEG